MKYVFAIAIVGALIWAGWQIADPEISNVLFQDDLHDAAAQLGLKTGMYAPSSDDELRLSLVRDAWRRDIALDPKQITIRRSGSGVNQTIEISVDYSVPVNLVVYSFVLHFNPTSGGARI
jgi:hypothetical protein